MGKDKRKRRKSSKEQRKDRRKRKRRSRSSSGSSGGSGGGGRPPPPSPQRLLLAAALGDRPLCRQLVQQGADVAYADAEGATALHEACRHGHLPAARLLLRRGADAGLADARGDTPAHLAARHGHLDLLAELLQADRPPEIEAVNARGESVAALAARAMDAADVSSFRREAREAEAEPQGARSPSPPLDDEQEWQRRLAAELSGGEGGGEELGAFGGGDWHADEYETPEEYARRIWEEMQAHRRAAEQRERAAFAARRRTSDAAREAFHAHAHAASQAILDEERRKDAAWRAAVAEGQSGARRASYEARWQFFSSRPPAAPVGFDDVPWVLPDEEAPQDELRRVVLCGAEGPDEQRKRLRTELIRWHPDKFVSKFGRVLAPADRERVLTRVVAMSQQLNAIAADVQQARQA